MGLTGVGARHLYCWGRSEEDQLKIPEAHATASWKMIWAGSCRGGSARLTIGQVG